MCCTPVICCVVERHSSTVMRGWISPAPTVCYTPARVSDSCPSRGEMATQEREEVPTYLDPVHEQHQVLRGPRPLRRGAVRTRHGLCRGDRARPVAAPEHTVPASLFLDTVGGGCLASVSSVAGAGAS